MANFNKAFNFRGGFQVDTDVLVVRGQSVGIGSSIPTERLDVDGIIKANGLRITSTEDVELESATAGILTVTDYLTVGIESANPSAFEFPFVRPEVLITTGIITSANPSAGVVTYYGDGAQLLNLPTSQWLDVDVGLGFTSIYAQGYVGVNTDDPRYVFQVGGVPYTPKAGFTTSQEGVGIESGSIWASDNISVGGTITAEAEFIGVGSLLIDLNADNILYGTISSERYGDINAGIVSVGILTASQYVSSPVFIGSTYVGDTFSGIASFAVGVLTTSQLDFDTAVANEFKARDRFISTEGKLQIGDGQNENIGAGASVGDVDVYKFSDSSYIYSISNSSNSKVFVGRERAGSNRRRFGGLRYGGSSVDSTSEANDLDVVNYDVGNLNFYLHSGSGGLNATEGSFQWIYGQNDNVLASLSKDGKFSLNGNPLTGESTLEVIGIATFKDEVYVDGNVNVGGATSLSGDLTVDGIITINGGVEASDDLQFKGAEFSGDVVVTDGLEYVAIGTVGVLTATNEIQMVGSGGTTVRLNSDGTISATSTIQTNTDVVAGAQVTAPTIEATTTLRAPSNFIVDVNGLRVDRATVGILSITESEFINLTVADIDVTSELAHTSGSVTINSSGLTATTVAVTDLNSVNVDVSNAIAVGANSINQTTALLPSIESTDITVSNNLTADSIDVATIDVTDNLTITSGVINAPEITVVDLAADNLNVTNTITTINLNADLVSFNRVTTPLVLFESIQANFIDVVGVGSFDSVEVSNTLTTFDIVINGELATDSISVGEIGGGAGGITTFTGNTLDVQADLTTTRALTVDDDYITINETEVSFTPAANVQSVEFEFTVGANLKILAEINGGRYEAIIPLSIAN